MGADFFEADHYVLRGYAKRFGLTIVPRGMRYSEREPRGVDTTPEAVGAVAELARGMLLRPPGGERRCRSRRCSTRSTSIRPRARRCESRVEVSSAHGADGVDARVLGPLRVELRRPGVGPDRRGQRRASHVASPRASATVCACRRRPSRSTGMPTACVVHTPRGEWIADYAHRRGARRDPEDAAVRARAARRQARRAGAAADRDGGEAVRSADRADRAVGDAVGAGALLGVDGARRRRRRDAGRELLRRLAGGGRAAARRARARPTWVASLRRLRPDLELDEAGAVVSTWDDPWAQGVYSVSSPAALPEDEDAICRAEPPLVFCGEHTARGDGGLMEGALRSGLRAAEVVGSLRVIAELTRAVGAEHVMTDPAQMASYACDGLTGYRVTPQAVVLPATTDEVAACVRICHEAGVPFVARGAGTGLSGGALPVAEGVVICVQRLRSRPRTSTRSTSASRCSPASPTSRSRRRSRRTATTTRPIPSSQQVCTIGGNVAENSGGAHCLKYGFTIHHVLAGDVRDGRRPGRDARPRGARQPRARPARRRASARRARSASSPRWC